MNSREQATRLDISSIQPIAPDVRHGRAQNLFTVWLGSNVHLLIIVTSASPRVLDILAQLLFVASGL
jgi:NCS1 family nucleobase:cation symporter-1